MLFFQKTHLCPLFLGEAVVSDRESIVSGEEAIEEKSVVADEEVARTGDFGDCL